MTKSLECYLNGGRYINYWKPNSNHYLNKNPLWLG